LDRADYTNDSSLQSTSFTITEQRSPLLSEVSNDTGAVAIHSKFVHETIAPPKKPLTTGTQDFRNNFTEDSFGLFVGIALFIYALILAACDVDIRDYLKYQSWSLGGMLLILFIVVTMHYLTKRTQLPREYCMVILLALVSRDVGSTSKMKDAGLSPAFWCIVSGFAFSSTKFITNQNPLWSKLLNAECFIKLGVILLAMDWRTIGEVGGKGLLVAWLDTWLVATIGIFIGVKLIGMKFDQATVISGAASICGSSAATSISSAIARV
jgi:uncharacterized membrane protein YadS